jgi:hypothetical protein
MWADKLVLPWLEDIAAAVSEPILKMVDLQTLISYFESQQSDERLCLTLHRRIVSLGILLRRRLRRVWSSTSWSSIACRLDARPHRVLVIVRLWGMRHG